VIVDFAFSEEQDMLRSQARSFLADKLPPGRVAEVSESEAGWDRATWRAMAELGWIGLSAPEEHGGAGMSFVDEAVLFEELGRGLFPGPYFATVGLALPALERAPEHLAAVCSGDSAATVAWAEPGGPHVMTEMDELSTKAESSDGGWTLSGEKHLVPDVAAADVVVVAARSSGAPGLWLLARDAPGVSARSAVTVDAGRRLGVLRLDGAEGRLLAEGDEAAELVERIRLRALAALALEAVGVGGHAMDLAVAYATERRQFGKPIGAYQAVSHQVANAFVEVELARSLAYWAAWCVAEGDEAATVAAAAAKALGAEAAVAACERSIQVHGGIGFTWEQVLHRYYKRALWIESFEGHPAAQRAAVAGLLLDRAP
jgi:alkylation response protein AidB-like acyl-CoA dehydrogenase